MKLLWPFDINLSILILHFQSILMNNLTLRFELMNFIVFLTLFQAHIELKIQ